MRTYSSWMEEKIALALELKKGSCRGTYADGAVILCVSISTMSSCMWIEKNRTDRSRFIEIVARFPGRGFDATTVSVPLISQDHIALKQMLGVSDLAFVYTGDHDKSEADVITACSAGMNKSLDDCKRLARKYSYASLLYEHVRCGFIHTYGPKDSATSHDSLWEMFDRGVPKITYVNYLAAQRLRKIHFPLEWISEVARNIASGMDAECSRSGKFLGQNLDLPAPATWWIEGG
jgi:hypothetical protein